jgi:hypothetical protein
MDASRKAYFAVAVAALLVILAGAPALADAPKGAEGEAQSAEKLPAEILYCVEFRGPCGPPAMPSFLCDKVAAALLKEGFQVSVPGQPPLVSREDLKHSLVATQGETELRTGRIYAEVGPGSELSFKNKDGKSVVLQIDVSQVCWDLDRAAGIARAKEAKADYVILGRFQVEDLTADANVDAELGKQKSVRVSLDLVRVAVKDGRQVGAVSEERRQMDLSRDGAAAKAAGYLAEKASIQLRSASKGGAQGK